MVEKLNFNDKTENNGANDRGRLTAAEFNQVVNAVNDHTQQLDGLSFSVQQNADAYEGLATKDASTLYLILEDE